MTLDPLAGMVVVLAAPAGDDGAADADLRTILASTSSELLGSGAVLALVTRDRSAREDVERSAALQGVEPPVAWAADPADPDTWERLYPHIEQRLGPVDAVLAQPVAIDLIETVFRPDMQRRGHGAIVPLSPAANPVTAIRTQLRHTP